MPIVKPMLHGGCGQGWQDGFQVMAAIMIMELVTTVMIVEAEVASSAPHPLGHPCKGSRKNNFTEFSLRFRLDLADLNERSHRNSELFRGVRE